MRRKIRIGIAFFLALMICIGLIPMTALAVDQGAEALTISKTVTLPGTLTLTSADFSALAAENSGTLASIKITGSNPAFGSFKLGSVDYVLGEAIPVASLASGELTFAATAAGTVAYTVEAYAFGDTETLIGTATLTITVQEKCGAGTVALETGMNTPVTFKADAFTDAFKDTTGQTLSHVTFAIPSPDWGILYENYRSSSDYDGSVTDQTKYSVDATPSISSVTFAPASGYTGTITISFTGYTAEDVSYIGSITINVGNVGENEGSDHFKDVGKNYAWAAEAIDYLYQNNIIAGVKPGYYNPAASISRGDFMLMLCRAFDLQADVSSNFSDVSKGSYYYDAIGIAKKLGIGKGSKGKFNPKAALSRQDAMVMLVRTMELAKIPLEAGSESDLLCYSDSNKISNYAADAIAALVKAEIIEGTGGKLNPKSSVSRAEMAVILYRILTTQESN